jgi:hypothetical protein
MSRDETERYAAELFKITNGKGAKMIVRPERMVSFDTSKDQALRNVAKG